MPRRTGARAQKATEDWYEDRLFRLLCNEDFQKAVNKLRGDYKEWKAGPPLSVSLWDGEDATETDLRRETIDLHGQPFDHRDDPFLCAWGMFESAWGIRLPVDALQADHDLERGTVDEWTIMLRPCSVFPRAGALEEEGLGTTPLPHTILFRFSPDVPADLLQERFAQEVKRLKDGHPKTRCRGDKLGAKRRAHRKAVLGLSTAQIAQSERITKSTAKSRIAAVSRIVGEKPAMRKDWPKWHRKTCPICREIGTLSYAHCGVARHWMWTTAEANKRLRQPIRPPSTAHHYLPWRPVRSEKSAFAKWDAQHPSYDRSG